MLKWTPHKLAILVAWLIYAGVCLISYLALGWEFDWWGPMIWPTAFVLYVTWIILRWERNARKGPSADQSGTESHQNLNRPPRG
jgi:CHASE2 domain-containing sensor protein